MIDEDELMALIARYEARLQALEARTQNPPDPTDIQVQNKSFTANEGQHCIVECPPAGLTVLLPHARPQNRNARITFTLRNSNPVRFIAVNGWVNGRASGVMASPGTFDAVSDGVAGWGISVLASSPTSVPTLSADFVVGVANPGLPNARIATASVEITPSIAVPKVISWALNAGSVVLSRLQNLTGLSVLGRAANSTGVMAAITAGGAQQYLRSNVGGTSLEWADPASASIVNTGGQFVRAALTGDVTAAQGLNSTAFRSFSSRSVLANASGIAAVPSDLAGTAAFQHLRVNSANNGLEWSVLTSGDFPAGTIPLGSLATQASDTFVGNVSGAVQSPIAVALSSLAGAGLVFGTHTLDVTAGAGASLVVSANDVQRGALTGAVTAAQDSNTTAFRSFAAKSVLANATNAAAVPSDFAGTVANTYLRVNAANTALEYGALPAGVMPTIQPGSFLGLQISAVGATAAIEITGKEAGENIRFDSEILDTTTSGSTVDYPLLEDRNWIHFSNAAALTLHGVSVLSASGGTALHPEGKPYIVSCGSASGGIDLIQQSATETNAARRFQNPGQIDFHMFPGETALVVRKLISATTNHRIIGRARSAVKLNAGAISPVETINFSDSSRINVTSSSISAGVASMLFNTITAAQLDLDTGTDINKALTSVLLGHRPGLTTSSNTGTVNSTAVQVGPLYTVPANTMVAGSCYLLIGFASFVRSTTTTAITLVTSLTVPAAVPVTAGIAASVTPSVNRGALVFAFVHCETSGAGGTARANVGVVGQWGAGGATATDMTASTIAVSINTTIANTLSLGVACSAPVAGAGVFWQNSAVLRIK